MKNLFGEFHEEYFSQPLNLFIFINDASGHLTDLTLHFDHIVKYKVGQDRYCAPTDQRGWVSQPE